MSDSGSDLEIGHASNGSERVRQEARRPKKKKRKDDQCKQVANKKGCVPSKVKNGNVLKLGKGLEYTTSLITIIFFFGTRSLGLSDGGKSFDQVAPRSSDQEMDVKWK